MTARDKSATVTYDPWDSGASGPYADHVFEQDRPTYSRLLGPDGAPLAYEKQAIGFDLSRRRE